LAPLYLCGDRLSALHSSEIVTKCPSKTQRILFILTNAVLAVLERKRKAPWIRAKARARSVVDRPIELKICLRKYQESYSLFRPSLLTSLI
jgi:hypothetical protein